MPPGGTFERARGFSSDRVFLPQAGRGGRLEPTGGPVDIPDGVSEELLRRQAALEAITAKAARLGAQAGLPVGSLTAVEGGWMRAYEGCDIYFGADTGAHEIHGDIRAKYNARHGVFWLGLPVTDETRTSGGEGRFNHFQRGSIHWAPHTGPMIVTGAIRDRWAAEGWEGGSLGYPVADEHQVPGLDGANASKLAWVLFENGMIVTTADGTDAALSALLAAEDLRVLVRQRVDEEVHRSPENIGLHAPVETLAVSGWSYGFWGALPRVVTLRLHGFRDMGLAPDTNFELDLRLRIGTAAPASLSEPEHRSVIAALDGLRVQAEGTASEDVAQGVFDGVRRAFFRGGPDPGHPEVPDGAVFVATFPTGFDPSGGGRIDVLDAFLTHDGGLRVLVNPLPRPTGELRKMLVQRALDVLAGR
jgi:hypothetical protein